MRRTGLLALAAFLVIAAAPFLLERWAPGLGGVGDVAAALQAAVTTAAVVVGGAWAYVKFQAFRDFEPHLTITQAVSHRSVSSGYVHLAVTATLRNSSKVKVEIRKGAYWLQTVAPFEDEQIDDLYREVFVDGREKSIQWPVYDTIEHAWEEGEFVIEPGESHQETYEFIVSHRIESVAVYAYFKNPRRSKSSRTAEGWSATTVYDIVRSG